MRAPEPEQSKSPGNIGFFGQLSTFKGAKVMLEAMALLDEDVDAHLWLHGANLELQTQEFRDEFAAMHDEISGRVTFRGPYAHSDLPKLMADLHWVVVPSIWWENSPLVIQEAFFHGRPVICSDVGGMAEKVRDGVDGIHFRRNDAFSLAGAFETAATSPRLWKGAARRNTGALPDGHPRRAVAGLSTVSTSIGGRERQSVAETKAKAKAKPKRKRKRAVARKRARRAPRSWRPISPSSSAKPAVLGPRPPGGRWTSRAC